MLNSVSAACCEDDYVSNLCDERVIEVCEIPAGTRQSTLTLILESARHSGVAGVTVEAVQFLTEDHSHALVTLNSAEGSFFFFLYEVARALFTYPC